MKPLVACDDELFRGSIPSRLRIMADEPLSPQLRVDCCLSTRVVLFHAGGEPLHGPDCPACLRQLCLAHPFFFVSFVLFVVKYYFYVTSEVSGAKTQAEGAAV